MCVCGIGIALSPGLTPAFVTCSTNVGGGLVKLITCNDIPGRWVDVWRSGTFILYTTAVKWLSKLKKLRQDCLMSSARSFYSRSVFVIGSTLT